MLLEYKQVALLLLLVIEYSPLSQLIYIN